jgi:hypothetical protein
MIQTVNQNHLMYPFFTQITKKSNLNQIIKCIRKSHQDIRFKSKHQLYL